MRELIRYDQKELESLVREWWVEHKIVEKLPKLRAKGKKYFLLDGPPYVNASAHQGNFKTTVCKDVWAKFKLMQGFNVWLQPGFDTHGLPVEVFVEQELGVKTKSDIEQKIGIEKFSKACLEKVLNNEGRWMALYKQSGAWRGWFDPYFTFKDYYIESAWWTTKKLAEKELLVEGDKTLHWCPHCETALSGYEVSDSYADLKSPSVFLKFRVKGRKNEFLLVWTTTPWTLPANVAIAAHSEEDYARVKVGDEVLILAKARLKPVLEDLMKAKYKVLETFKGRQLEGLEYEPLMDNPGQREAASKGKAHRVYLSIVIMANKKYKKHVMKDEAAKPGGISGEKPALAEPEEYEHFVTMDAGTGLVHTAPGHGQTDNFFGKHYGLPILSPVDEKGRFTKEAGEFEGKSTSQANELIIEKLKHEGKIAHFESFMHRAAVCWRCKTPLIFRQSVQWYMKVDPIKERMLAENQKTRWLPSFGLVKFQNWLADREDWALSQQRYWGIPMPIWICKKCGSREIIGSKKELQERAIEKVKDADLSDLHRHTVDKILLQCKNCGGTSQRVPHIFTVWFDSGIAPWAGLGYPFKNKELFESLEPCDMICESQDQIRGWFDSLLLCSVGAFNHSSYKAVSLMGWVLDDKGEKISKSARNGIDAAEVINRTSADAVRAYYCWEVAPWEVQKFSFKTAQEIQRALTILWNSLAFFETYKEEKTEQKLESLKLEPEDRWVLSKLNNLTESATSRFENFEFHLAGRELLDFVVEDLSRWYIKLVRDRVSAGAEEHSRKAALTTLQHALFQSAKLLAPITPFISEYVFQKIKSAKDQESVHHADWPAAQKSMIDQGLEKMMALSRSATEAVGAARQEAGLKLRWPLREVAVKGGSELEQAVRVLQDVLQRSFNAEKVVFVAAAPKGNWVEKAFEGGTVFVPKTLDEEMLSKALYRELIRAVQEARKKNGFNVKDSITITISADSKSLKFLEKTLNELKKEVGASHASIVTAANLEGEFEATAGVEERSASAKFSKAKIH